MLAPELRGKARLQLLSIIQEHNELIGRGDQNESKAQQIQNQKFFEQALKILLTGGEFNPETNKSYLSSKLEANIMKVMNLYQPKNASKAQFLIPAYDSTKAHRKSQQFKRHKYLNDLQH